MSKNSVNLIEEFLKLYNEIIADKHEKEKMEK